MQGGVIKNDIIYPDLSYKIVGVLYEISNNLGGGYQEKHYQRVLEIAFTKYNINFIPQCPYKVKYKRVIIEKYFMDFIIENKIVLETKRGDYFSRGNINQISSYLRATGLKLGILANFTNKGLRYKRIVNLY